MNDEAFLAFLKAHYPYLYDIEMKVRKIQDQTGFGEVSIAMTVSKNKVIRYQIGEFFTYKQIDDAKNLP